MSLASWDVVSDREKAHAKSKSEVDKLQAEDQKFQHTLGQHTAALDDISLKVNNLVKKKGDSDEKLRSLTVVSSEMAKYKEMTPQQLMKQLGATNKALGKFEHVNKKAIDQSWFALSMLCLMVMLMVVMIMLQFMSSVDAQKEETMRQTLERVVPAPSFRKSSVELYEAYKLVVINFGGASKVPRSAIEPP
ncbi:hypothetical protein AK812_SmicGene3885 [Symbiodinium microadriaticum]|uniref:Uncharacterized protein n=1 Tax=Symbiodinium microadriaticum TaxID=2951 RepID=A0A1Q9EXX2_SYMMI|nr:hypothetical protein AK812_SmicGene3885 [Symbiodinium microadriaticum]